jgi:formylglycine-generating enzyme required for sulfatase activity
MKNIVQTIFLLAIIAIQVKVFGQDSVKFEMVFVEGGTFTMGCTPEQKNCDKSSKPAHQVTLDDFYIGKYEVTQAQWEALMGSNHSEFKGANRPADKINWQDTQKFIRALNRKTGLKYRLPTNAEWEYAARGGNQSKGYRYSGSDKLDEVAWYGKNSGDATHDVGTKKPNELGIYDMNGNVYEWINDWYTEYTTEPQNNPKGRGTPEGPINRASHTLRGGDFGNSKLVFFCIANREIFWDIPERLPSVGFRLAHDKVKKSK